MNISKQTQNIVDNVLVKQPPEDWQLKYVPHGVNKEEFYPISEINVEEYKDFTEYKDKLLGNKEYDFIMFYNSRNIRRKSTSDIILAYKIFCDKLPKEESEKCLLLLHTDPVDNNGTDLPAVVDMVCPEYDVKFSTKKVDVKQLNYLYNMSDVTVSLSSAEGFGLGTCESLMAGTPILVNVTGGLQDQCGFVDDKNEPYNFTPEWPSNSNGRYKTHGDWAKVVYPTARSLVGSIPTPYIFDSRCSFEDAADMMMEWYKEGKEERQQMGLSGRDYVLDPATGMESGEMCRRFIESMNGAFDNWKPAKPFGLFDANYKRPKDLSAGIALERA